MPLTSTGVWEPDAVTAEQSNVAALIGELGLGDYDALYRLSIEEPDTYWRAVLARCNIQWSQPYEAFADYSRGPEFAKWFVNGRLNWTDTIFAWARDPQTRDRIALIAENESGEIERISFAELRERVRRLAGGLQALGLRPGDRVGFLMEPNASAVVSMLALSYIGTVVLPLFSGFGVDPIVSRLSLCRAKALISTTGFYRRGKWIDREAVAVQSAAAAKLEYLILRTSDGSRPSPETAVDWHDLAAAEPAGPVGEPMASDDPFMIFFTSGTTGKPKGIVHSHGGFPLKIAHDAFVHFDMKPGDTFFWPADMGWIAGALIIAGTLIHGATMLCYDGAYDVPDLSRVSRMIERHKVTHFGTAPTMIRAFAANPELSVAGDVSSLRLMITGGESISAEHFVWHQRHFGSGLAPLINYSGGTEASGALISSVIVRSIPPGGFNTASPGIATEVVNAEGEPIRQKIGELVVLAPFVGMTCSFWEDDRRYLETYWQTIPGMWVHGDLAERDRDGNFYIRGRSDDTIKLAGKRTGPAEIEDVLLEVPEAIELAAIGVDDSSKGQILVVFAVCHDGVTPEGIETALQTHADARLGRAFRPARVHLVRELPKTRSGKVMRRLIRSVYCLQPTGDLSSLENLSSLDEIARVVP
ncbi:MAG: AMP-binding protein [Novosphingobium sp.]|nr:AMP-binding protein [Novosphingobium sp.]